MHDFIKPKTGQMLGHIAQMIGSYDQNRCHVNVLLYQIVLGDELSCSMYTKVVL